MKKVLFLLLLIPTTVKSQRFYKLYSSIEKGLYVRVKNDSTLLFKLTSKNNFNIGAGDTMKVHFTNGHYLYLVCTGKSSFNPAKTGLESYYNGLYFPFNKELSKHTIKSIDIGQYNFELSEKGNKALKRLNG